MSTRRNIKPRRLYTNTPSHSHSENKFHFRVKFHSTRPTAPHPLYSSRYTPHAFQKAQLTTSMAHSNSRFVDPRVTELVVVRHGETEWNADGRIQGHLDVELNHVGREQASLVAERLSKEFQISAVYSSDLKRALVTAETIASRCGGLEVVKDPELRERHLGDLQGHRLRDAFEFSPEAYKAFVSGNKEIPGGGESLAQLFDRCTSSVERIADKHRGEQVAVVTHGGVIRQLFSRACPNDIPRGKVLNTSIHIFQLSDEEKWTLKSWGDISHLNQTGYLQTGFGGDGTSG